MAANLFEDSPQGGNVAPPPAPPLPPPPEPEPRPPTAAVAGLQCLSQAAAQAPRAAPAAAPNRRGVESDRVKCDCRGCPTFPNSALMNPNPCSNTDCTKLVHVPCWGNLVKKSKTKLPDFDENRSFCTIACAKKYEKNNVVTRFTWRNDGIDGPNDPNNSEMYLVNMMSTGTNYAKYRSPPQGYTKLSWCNKIASELNSSNQFMREITGAQVKSKLEDIEKSWKAADYFVNSETGAGIKARSEGEFDDAVLAKCPHYYDLYDVFIDRAGFKPKATNQNLSDSDSEKSDISDYGQGGGFGDISLDGKDDKSIGSNKSVISVLSSTGSVQSSVSNLVESFSLMKSPTKDHASSRRRSSATRKKARSKSAPASKTPQRKSNEKRQKRALNHTGTAGKSDRKKNKMSTRKQSSKKSKYSLNAEDTPSKMNVDDVLKYAIISKMKKPGDNVPAKPSEGSLSKELAANFNSVVKSHTESGLDIKDARLLAAYRAPAFKACLLPTEFLGLNTMAAEFSALEAEAGNV